jgi:lysophospholipase L1-like esterase
LTSNPNHPIIYQSVLDWDIRMGVLIQHPSSASKALPTMGGNPVKTRVPPILFIFAFALTAAAQDRWVATWAASPQAASFNFPLPKQNTAPKAEAPAPKPEAQDNQPSPFAMPPGVSNQTVRMIVRTSIGGSRTRVQLSNAYGTGPLTVGAARIALKTKGSAIISGSDKSLSFGGNSSVVIPPGAPAVSDPLEFPVPVNGDMVISLYIAGEPTAPTLHLTGLHTTYISKPGDFTKAAEIANATTTQSWYWISEVDVVAPREAGAIVAFGDSITDGATSTPDTDRSWPSQLAQRLAANKATKHIAIVNHGISGNRVLADGAGVSALARFDRDVIATPGVQWLIVMEGINDIGISVMMNQILSADDIIAGHKQLIERAHMRGIKAIGATLLPYGGASYYSEKGESIRQGVNQWIRTSKAYDAVVDFDAKLRDPQNPSQLNAVYYINDHLHPNDAGYKLMAETVDLSLFK